MICHRMLSILSIQKQFSALLPKCTLSSEMKRACPAEEDADRTGTIEAKKSKSSVQATVERSLRREGADTLLSPDGEEDYVGNKGKSKKKKKKEREIDWAFYKKRHIALKIAYLGWDYNGFAIQDTPGDTIEGKIFEVLQTAKLVEDIKKARYFKCGRTDKGVSALGQVISLQVRSNLLEGEGVITPDGCRAHERKSPTDVELPYVEIFNRLLPPDIRVLSWAPVGSDFNARFSCKYRVYKYFFPLGGMDINILQKTSKKFVGSHDFRNFCKLDRAGDVTNFVREILDFDIVPVNPEEMQSAHRMYQATITGRAFLWHQVRCMVAILFLVGLGLEKPEVIDHMLDVEKCPRKPQYGMASEIPLILFASGYDDISWTSNEPAERHILQHIQDKWSVLAVQSAMLTSVLQSLATTFVGTRENLELTPPQSQLKGLMSERVGGVYKPLLSRPSADPVEERLARKKKPVETKEAD